MIAITKRLLLLSPLLVAAKRVFAQSDDAPVKPGPSAEALAIVARKAVSDYFIPAYEQLQKATAALVAAMGESCRTPGATPDPAVQAAFETLLQAWARVDFLRFGPMAEKARLERFSFLPDPHGTGTRQLRQILAKPDPALLEPGAIAKRSAAVQGLPAFEALVFGASDDAETAAYRCQLALRIAENLHTIAGEAVTEWTRPGGWRELMLKPGGANIVYRDATEPLVEVLKAIVTGLQQMRDQRLLPALGKSIDKAKPNRGAFVRSGESFAYLNASIDGIDELVERSDVFSLTPNDAATLLGATEAASTEFRKAINVGKPWSEAFADPAAYDSLKHAFDVLKTLEDIFNFRFAEAAGISPGFNALDGD
jgi:predicted lipoprotein